METTAGPRRIRDRRVRVSRWLRAVHQSLGTFALAGLLVALVLGGTLRFAYANWDRGGHLHPDERYMSIVANDTRWPSGPIAYFDVANSPLSPYNTESGRSYVYGQLPLTTAKLVAGVLGKDDYDHLYLVARHVSAFIDTATIALVFVLALLLMDEWGRRRAGTGAAVAALLYAVTVTAIQHAHFFTVDSWLVFLTVLTFLLAVSALRGSEPSAEHWVNRRFVAVGVGAGLTVACKVPGALVLVPVGVALLADGIFVGLGSSRSRGAGRLAATGVLTLVTAYVTFRTVSPYTFARSNWLDLTLNDGFRSALNEEFRRVNGEFLFPPSYQWLLSTPVWGPLQYLVHWQLGVPLGLVALAGIGLLLVRVVRAARLLAGRGRDVAPSSSVGPTTRWLMLLLYVLVVFFWIAPRFAHMGRYLVPITPFLAVSAAYALVGLLRTRRRLLAGLAGVVIVSTALYGIAFEHVYAGENTRMAASDWIVENVPPGSRIANEHWDDSLPVGGPAQAFTLLELPVFEPDDDTKLHKLFDVLAVSDYYAVSSPRAWKTIGRLPDRFPLMTRFYGQLFAGKLGFTEVASFTREPELLGFHLNDLSAEEAFWVYDHPPVRIYRRTEPLGWEQFRTRLCPVRNTRLRVTPSQPDRASRTSRAMSGRR